MNRIESTCIQVQPVCRLIDLAVSIVIDRRRRSRRGRHLHIRQDEGVSTVIHRCRHRAS